MRKQLDKRRHHRIGVFRTLNILGGGGPSYIFRDEFSDTRAAGSVNGTLTTDGKDTRAVVDTGNKLSVGGGVLSYAPKSTPSFTDPNLFYSGRTRTAGLAMITVVNGSNANQNYIGFSTSRSTPTIPGFRVRQGTLGITADAAHYTETDILCSTISQYATALRLSGSFMLAKVSGVWKLLWVENVGDQATMYPGFAAYNATGSVDYIRLAQLPAPFDTDYGLATDRLAGARALNDVYTHEADCIVEWTVTTLPSDSQYMAIRKQDDNNYWRIDVAADGSIALQEVVAGTPTSRGTGAAASIANGQRMVVIADGETIKVYANNVLKITYASAANFKTATAGKLLTLGTGGAVSDIVSWPRTLSGTAASVLSRYAK